MFADPITITLPTGGAKVMARQSTNGTSAVYATSDGLFTLTISHQNVNKNNQVYVRTVSRLDQKKVVADPLTAVNDYQTLTTYTIEERPSFGFTNTEVKDQLSGYQTWLVLTATQDKLLGRES
jgi:hypothetical protein